MDYIKELYELCETLSKELKDTNEKIRSAGGKLSAGDLEVIDKLTHAIKSIKATIAMMEQEEGYSNEGGGSSMRGYSRNSYGRGGSYARGGSYNRGGSYDDGGSYEGGSYDGGSYDGGSYRYYSRARGRGANARRDSMGRYSRAGDLSEQLRELMADAPNDQIKQEMQMLASRIEQQM